MMPHQASCDEITRALDQLTIDNNDSGLSPQAAALNQKLKRLSETERQIVLHVLLLNHTVTCRGCTSPNCATMRGILTHRENCVETGCDFCGRINKLIAYHSRVCRRREECRACNIGKFQAPTCVDCTASVAI
eukprot:gene8694-9410_t